jgi:uncharacterized membrane protein
MKTLFAISYPDVDTARAALSSLQGLQKGATISIADAVIVTRDADGAVKLDQSINMTAVGAASGALWGSLIGLLFLSPLIGAAVGATAGAVSGYMTDYGISDEFMRDMGQKQSGARATLFILAGNLTADKVAAVLNVNGAEVIYTSMPDDIEERFKLRFAHGNSGSLMQSGSDVGQQDETAKNAIQS